MPRQRDLGWLEGILDGEGSLCLSRRNRKNAIGGYIYVPLVSIVSTDIRLLERTKLIIGKGSISSARGIRRLGKRLAFQYVITSRVIRNLFPLLRLTSKERQRKLLLEAVRLLGKQRNQYTTKTHYDRLDEIYAEMRKLNQKGSKTLPPNSTNRDVLIFPPDRPRDSKGHFSKVNTLALGPYLVSKK